MLISRATIGTVPDALEEGRRASPTEVLPGIARRVSGTRPAMRRTLLALITAPVRRRSGAAATPRSTGGTPVPAGAHPAVVLIEGTDIFGEVESCTGVLVAKRVVVTSVTCVFFIDLDAAQVIVGRTSRTADNGRAIAIDGFDVPRDARPRPARARRRDQDPARRRRARDAGAAGRRRQRRWPARPARSSAGAP